MKRLERRRTKDLREEVRTKACLVGKIVKNMIKSAGHMVRMKDERLPKRSETKRLQKTSKTIAKMEGLSEERSKEGRGRRKVDRKAQQQGAVETNNKISHIAP